MEKELLEKFKNAMIASNYAAGTIARYLSKVDSFLKHFYGNVEYLATAEVNEYIDNLQETPSVTSKISHSIKLFYDLCFDRSVKTRKVRKCYSAAEVFTADQINLFLNYCKGIKEKAMFATMYGLGLRRGELLNLKVSDITSDSITIRDSKGDDRKLTLHPELREILRTYWKEYRPTSYMFSIEREELRLIFKKILADAHLSDKATLHTLRHSAGTELYKKTKDLVAIKNFLGHRSIDSTMVYTRNGGGNLPNLIHDKKYIGGNHAL